MTMEAAMLETNIAVLPAPLPHFHAAPSSPLRLPKPWLVPGLISGALLWLAFYPMSWGPAAWFALVPLLTLVRLPVSRWRLFLGAYLSGCVFFFAALQWMRVADYRMYATWGMLSVYISLYFPAGIFLIRFLDRRTPLPLLLSVPLVWTALEFIRSFLMTGFAWYFLGHSQHANLPLIQIADLAGVYGISFLLAAVNGWLLECVWRVETVRRFLGVTDRSVKTGATPLIVQGVALAALLAATVIYGNSQLAHTEFQTGPTVAMLQSDIDTHIRNQTDGGAERASSILATYNRLSDRAYWRESPDLIVWPETSYPYTWLVLPEKGSATADEIAWAEWHKKMVRAFPPDRSAEVPNPRASHLIGLNCRVMDGAGHYHQYNSALLFPFAANVKMDRYDKIHRIPFGEYVPLRNTLPFMNYFAPYDSDYSVHVGEKQTRFVLGKYRFGVLICNEDADPVLGRAYGGEDRDGPAVDFLINISNDGWFTDTCEHEQHLALCRFRAIECRRAVARAVNTGISAIIDSNGRVLKPEHLPLFEHEKKGCQFWEIQPKDGVVGELPEAEWPKYKNAEAVLRGTMPIDHRGSLYVQWGDWLPMGCCMVIGLGFVWGFASTVVRASARFKNRE
jgi:apolipoprotein N-acyltransferase